MYLVTGSAGFIGFHTCIKLLKQKKTVIGIDNLNDYYDINLKKKRNSILKKFKNYYFFKINICNKKSVNKVFRQNKIKTVIHLAAQAGVRYSIQHPEKYIETNIVGFFNIIDGAKNNHVKHFIFASSSSIYGNVEKFPLSESLSASHPAQIYAATKRSNELIAHSYSSLFNLPTTGLRFFTVYGPWGRPDMAWAKFANNIANNKEIEVFNHGNHSRDFSYIDDVVKVISKVISKVPKINKNWNSKEPDPKTSYCPYRVINVGGNNPIKLLKFIRYIEKELKQKAKIKYLPLQKGDVIKTQASPLWCKKIVGYIPKTKPSIGIKKFIKWYKEYYR